MTFSRKTDQIDAEAALYGIYVLRTSLPQQALTDHDVVLRYKGLEDVERFFRTLNSELDVRPIRHRLEDRVRAHVFLRMLSYYIAWHMKQALAPILFYDHDKNAAAAKRTDPVAAAQRSDAALTKAARKRTQDNYPVHSFTSLLKDLATCCVNYIQPAHDMPAFTELTTPTPLNRELSNSLKSPPLRLHVGSTPHRQSAKPRAHGPNPSPRQGELRSRWNPTTLSTPVTLRSKPCWPTWPRTPAGHDRADRLHFSARRWPPPHVCLAPRDTSAVGLAAAVIHPFSG